MVKKLVLFTSMMALGCALFSEAHAAKKISKGEVDGLKCDLLSVKKKPGKENIYRKGNVRRSLARHARKTLLGQFNAVAQQNVAPIFDNDNTDGQ